jgi:hypothetical protein
MSQTTVVILKQEDEGMFWLGVWDVTSGENSQIQLQAVEIFGATIAVSIFPSISCPYPAIAFVIIFEPANARRVHTRRLILYNLLFRFISLERVSWLS